MTSSDKTFHKRIFEEHSTGQGSGTAVLATFIETMGRSLDWAVVVFSTDVIR